MIDSPPAFIGDAGMRPVVSGEPVVRGVANSAVRAEHAGVEGRINVTTGAGSRESGKLPGRVALTAGQSRMRAGQWEVAAIVVEGRVMPI
jgi:hypothetical protein